MKAAFAAATAVLIVVATGCGAPATQAPADTADGLPTQPPSGAAMDALFEGRLAGDGQCLWFEDDEGARTSVRWPHGFSLGGDGRSVLDAGGGLVAQVGDAITASGGFATDAMTRCRVSERVWHAAGVRRGASEPEAGAEAAAGTASATPPASGPPAESTIVSPGQQTPAPASRRPAPQTTPTSGPRELGQDEHAAIGQPYRYRLLTHCGIVATWWNGAWWNADPPQSDGNGNPPPGWGNPYQDGVMTQVSATRLEFTGDQGQRADFVPRPAEDGAPPACD